MEQQGCRSEHGSARNIYLKIEFSPSYMGIGPMTKDSMRSLPPTAPPLMECVKVQDVGVENASKSGAELSAAGSNAYE